VRYTMSLTIRVYRH